MVIRLLILSVVLGLQGCAPGLMLVSIASIGATELTGRSLTDHALSTAHGQDCRGMRAFKSEEVCQDYPAEEPKTKPKVAVAASPKPTTPTTLTSIDQQEAVFALRRARSQ